MAKKLPVALNDETEKMLEQIKSRTGSPSLNAAINFAIFETHRSLFPAYIKQEGKGRSRAARAADERAEEESAQMEICKALDGRIEGEGANKICVYYTYHLRNRYEQRVSLDLLNEGMISTQYDPSKERVMKLKEEGQTKW